MPIVVNTGFQQKKDITFQDHLSQENKKILNNKLIFVSKV